METSHLTTGFGYGRPINNDWFLDVADRVNRVIPTGLSFQTAVDPGIVYASGRDLAVAKQNELSEHGPEHVSELIAKLVDDLLDGGQVFLEREVRNLQICRYRFNRGTDLTVQVYDIGSMGRWQILRDKIAFRRCVGLETETKLDRVEKPMYYVTLGRFMLDSGEVFKVPPEIQAKIKPVLPKGPSFNGVRELHY